MVSIFTALYPGVHNVQLGLPGKIVEGQKSEVDILSDNFETMAELLKQAGYATAGIQSNAVLKEDFGFAQGFDSYHFQPYPSFTADEVTQEAIDTVQRLEPPFFLYVHYMDPHNPYDPPEKYRHLFGAPPTPSDKDRALLADYKVYYRDRIFNDVGLLEERKTADLSEEGREYVRFLYDGEARFTDDQVARLIESIETQCGPTVVIVVADHGEEFWEHNSVGHGPTVYQEVVHVPLIVRIPETEPKRIDAAVETMDILPTVSAHLGLKPGPGWQGRNLLEVAEAASPKPQAVFSATKSSLRENNKHIETVIVWPEKLIIDLKTDVWTLYDLHSDGAETVDLTLRRPERTRELQGVLEMHWEENASHPEYSADPFTRPMDQEAVDQIKAIGYMGDPVS
jgi:arylsulfatase A-like enzyme